MAKDVIPFPQMDNPLSILRFLNRTNPVGDFQWFREFLSTTEKACRWGLCNGRGYEGGRCGTCGWPIKL